jgi:hypothetical protein
LHYHNLDPVVEEEEIYEKPRIILQKIQFDDPGMVLENLLLNYSLGKCEFITEL